jgi:hypothetical protein
LFLFAIISVVIVNIQKIKINIKQIKILNNLYTIKLNLKGGVMEFLIAIGFFFALITYSLYKENTKEDKESC